MKKFKLLALCGLFAIGATSCNKDISCSEAESAIQSATEANISSPSTANCKLLEKALEDLVDNSDCSQAKKDVNQLVLNALSC